MHHQVKLYILSKLLTLIGVLNWGLVGLAGVYRIIIYRAKIKAMKKHWHEKGKHYYKVKQYYRSKHYGWR
jgi:uncharacterized membrane protein YuzA (DUF378 family)